MSQSKKKEHIFGIYQRLFSLYGPQGWWPLIKHDGENPTKKGSIRGYHPGNYDLPENENQIFEIILGAILTQNTAWTSAEQAILNLDALNAIDPQKILSMDEVILKKSIRCAGFLNQKASYIKEISKFFLSLEGDIPNRKEILQVKGVGNETADSILLYAYKQPEFVVDAYTKRIFHYLGLIESNAKYGDVKELFESNLPFDISIFQEYHALIVEHAKRHYQKKPYGVNDNLKSIILK
ncbi:endonuclease III domain-containing protein [Methanobacterium alcaliphilum]|uniref:endonuclease III domain-containing protein n=1 Tax=Methanobacterium alcaliphilum TaxID=392018 RepID=UPI00200ACE5D|nr:endonuclease III domain-containing protein [Methanobacterium alcaliphilum]MCK9150804.1 endonuclease III domain-containing protein [Methanobacterium alcaliphilum]